MTLDIQLVQQINGDVRLDDGDEGPLLKIEFIAEFNSLFSDEEKMEVLDAASAKLIKILKERKKPEPEIKKPEPEVNHRREAIMAQRARSSE